jgi:hypothetical protein
MSKYRMHLFTDANGPEPSRARAEPSDKPVPTERIDKRVLQYIACRDEIEALKEKHKQELAPLEALKQQLTNVMLGFLDSTGQKSAKTAAGTVTKEIKPTAACSDPDLFVNFVREHDAYELMDRRANATACLDYAHEHDGALPPGVKINMWPTVRVTRP